MNLMCHQKLRIGWRAEANNIYYKNRTRSTKYRTQNKIQNKMHTTNPEGEIMSIAWKYRIQNKIHTTNQEVHMMSIESTMSA